jgi:hypothetical protein
MNMTGKDILTLLLVVYGFNKIDISTYRGVGGATGYRINASNDNLNIYYNDENCEGLLYNMSHIISQMREDEIEPTYSPFPGYDYSIKEILNLVKK